MQIYVNNIQPHYKLHVIFPLIFVRKIQCTKYDLTSILLIYIEHWDSLMVPYQLNQSIYALFYTDPTEAINRHCIYSDHYSMHVRTVSPLYMIQC